MELYEAAAIDGAGAWQGFTMITLPFLAPMIAITVMLRTIWISNFADLIVVMTGGGPANTTQILPSYIFTVAYPASSTSATPRRSRRRCCSCCCSTPPCCTGCGATCWTGRRYAASAGSPRRPGDAARHGPPPRAAGLSVAFALFPLYWLIKISVTPDRLLYAEGVACGPVHDPGELQFVLRENNFPVFF